jgi:hypothetical protein
MLMKSKSALKTARQRDRFKKAIGTTTKKYRDAGYSGPDTPVRLDCPSVRRGRDTLPPGSKGLSAVDGQSLDAKPLYATAMPCRQ